MSEIGAQRRTSALGGLVAAEVRALMGRRRITGAELARAIGVPQASLQRRLSGRYPFDVDLLGLIADYLDVPVETFFRTYPDDPEDAISPGRWVLRRRAAGRNSDSLPYLPALAAPTETVLNRSLMVRAA